MCAATPPARASTPDLNGLAIPSLNGRHVYLRAVVPDDYRFLHLVETSSHLAPVWRFRGSTPSAEQWAESTWGGTLAQFMVCARPSNAPLGLVAAYRANFQDGHAYIAAARFEPGRRSPPMVLGLAIFLDYVFACWAFEKLYMEVPEHNYAQFSSGEGRYFEVEGRLRAHTFLGGRRWDQLVLAVYRDSWTRVGQRLLAIARDPHDPSTAVAESLPDPANQITNGAYYKIGNICCGRTSWRFGGPGAG